MTEVSAWTAPGNASIYERGRPDYPAVAIDAVVDTFALDSTSRVVDLAAGTGKLTRLLAPRVGEVVAVEPSAELRHRLVDLVPGVVAVDGTAESMPLEDGSAAAVLVANAFHWFDPDGALAEIARVLAPGGGLAVLWHLARWTEDDQRWLAPLMERLGEHRAEVSVRGHERMLGWYDTVAGHRAFGPVENRSFSTEHRWTREDLLWHVQSWSHVAALEGAEREAAVAAARDALAAAPEEIVTSFGTEVFTTRRV